MLPIKKLPHHLKLSNSPGISGWDSGTEEIAVKYTYILIKVK